MISALLTLGVGFIVGLVFAYLNAPVPAPPTLTGVLGIAGLTVGYMVMSNGF
jgi:XapX domain-containing protein